MNMRKTDRDVARVFREQPEVFADYTDPSGSEDYALPNWELMSFASGAHSIPASGSRDQPELQFFYDSGKCGVSASLITWYGYELDPKYRYDVHQNSGSRIATVMKSHIELAPPSMGGYVYEDTISERKSKNPNRTFRALARLARIIEIQNSALSRKS